MYEWEYRFDPLMNRVPETINDRKKEAWQILAEADHLVGLIDKDNEAKEEVYKLMEIIDLCETVLRSYGQPVVQRSYEKRSMGCLRDVTLRQQLERQGYRFENPEVYWE